MRIRGRASAAACALLLAAPALAQQQPTTVAPLVVQAEPAPVPNVGEGAPLFSPREIELMIEQAREALSESRNALRRCMPNARAPEANLSLVTNLEIDQMAEAAEKNGGFILLPRPFSLTEAYQAEVNTADALRRVGAEADQATRAADRARREEITSRVEMERTELARQAAVKRLITARAMLEEATAMTAELQLAMRMGLDPRQALVVSDGKRRSAATVLTPPKEYADLALEQIIAREKDGPQGKSVVVSGEIRNTRARAVSVPPLRVTAFDASGFVLKSEVAHAQRSRRIQPGGSVPFAYELKPSPRNSVHVQVTFGTNASPPWHLPAGMFC